MQVSNPKEVFNMDNLLSYDGESGFEMSFSEEALQLNFFYQPDDSPEITCSIRFLEALYFFKTPDSYSFFSCPDDMNGSLSNSLVAYEHSDMLDMARGYKHYRLFLGSSNVALHVIARSCEISETESQNQD
jgi:hypothetical protein